MKRIKKILIEIIEVILGSFIIALAVSLFLLPNELSSGGFSGIATIIYYICNFPMGITMLILNVPLFLVAISKIGKRFFIKSILGTISLSFFIDFLDKFQPFTEDKILACVYGRNINRNRNSFNFKGTCINWRI